MLAHDLHVIRSEGDAWKLLRRLMATGVMTFIFSLERSRNMSYKSLRICQSFPESFYYRFGQSQELIE